jgi:transposase-like protein
MYQPEKIPSNAKIRKFLRSILFGKNIHCPECGSRNVVRYEKRYRCQKCRAKFSLLSHTWLADTKIELKDLWLILWCWTAQMPVRQAKKITGLSQKAVRNRYQDFRENLPQDKIILEKIVQLDEAYFGRFKGKALLMAKQKGARKLVFKVLDQEPTKLDAITFIRERIKPGSTVCTDGFSIYHGIESYCLVKHRVDIHKAWEYSATSEIEGVFGNLRTFIRRMYHHVTTEKLEEIVREFCYRFSHPKMYGNPRYYLKNSLHLVPTGC